MTSVQTPGRAWGRRAGLPAIALIAALAPVPAQERASQPPIFRAETPLVVVDAVVLDRDGEPIGGLTANDFEVSDAGAVQTVQLFQTVTAASSAASRGAAPRAAAPIATNVGLDARATRTFVLFFDDVHLMREHGERAKQAIGRFVETGLRDGDLVSLVVPGRALRWHAKIPEGREQLARIVASLEGGYLPDPSPERMTDYEAYRIHVFQDEVVAERVDRRWKNLRVLGREPVDPLTDRGFEPQNRGGNIGIIKQDIAIRAAAVYTNTAARNRATLDSLARTIESLAAVRGRKSLILVSPGFIDDQERREARAVLHAARTANVAVYFVDARGLLTGSSFSQAESIGAVDPRDVAAVNADLTLDAEGAETLAVQTGGFSVRNRNDLEGALRRIGRESAVYYLLGYQPSAAGRAGTFRRIDVRVRRPGVTVRARRGYFVAGPPADVSADKGRKADKDRQRDDLERAAESPYDLEGIPLRVAALVFGMVSPGRAATVLAADVDLRALEFERRGGEIQDVIEVLMLATHRDSGTTERYERLVEVTFPAGARFGEDAWHTLAQEFPLAPGRYQARVAVRDRRTGSIGAVTHEFEVPEPGAFRITSPILTDTIETPASGGAPKPVLVARRAFPAGSTLYYQFTVTGAARDAGAGTRVEAGHEIRRAGQGTVVRQMPPRLIAQSPGGALSRFSGLPLVGLDAGDYELVLRVVDRLGGRSIEHVEPFSLLPRAHRTENP